MDVPKHSAIQRPTSELRRAVGPWGLFCVAFGCIVGSGWVLVLGNWLASAGPGGAVVGLIAAMTVMLAVCAAYSKLVTFIPRAGGDFEYARILFGPRVAFAVGWFLTLGLVAVASFEGIALSWIVSTLIPAAGGERLYSAFGAPVTTGDLSIGLATLGALGLINFRGISGAARVQTWITFTFIAIGLCVIVCGTILGSILNLEAAFVPTNPQPWWVGSLWIASLAPFLLNGFQAVPQLVEERGAGVGIATMTRTMYLAIFCAALFYCAVVVSASMASNWRSLTAATLPAASAFELLLPHKLLSRLLLVGAGLSVIKTWNGMLVWCSRLVFAQARAGYMPATFSRIHPSFGTPMNTVAALVAVNALGIACGRGMLLPLLSMTSLAVGSTLVLAVIGALKVHRSHDRRVAPGVPWVLILALVGTSAMWLCELVQPWLHERGSVPLEWILLGGWAIAGVLRWKLGRLDKKTGLEERCEAASDESAVAASSPPDVLLKNAPRRTRATDPQ